MFRIISPSYQVPRISPRLRHRGPRDARQQTQEHVRHQRGGAQNRGAGGQQQRKVRQEKPAQQLFFRENLNINFFLFQVRLRRRQHCRRRPRQVSPGGV